VPNAPNAPTAGITVQPTCVNPTGSIVVTAPIGFQYEYSIGGAFQAATSFAGLAPSNYSIIVKDIITNCISTAVSLTVNAVPNAPNAPTATITVQPTCVNPTGTIVITNPIGSQYEYSIGGAFQSATTFVGQSPNTYSITVKDIITNCISTVVSLTVNAVANAPSPPIASVTQPNCKTLTGNIDVNSPIGVNLQYSIGGAYQSSTNFTGVLSNTYVIKVKDISTGCISTPNNAIVNPAPAIPTAPIVVGPLKYCADKIATPLSATGSSLLWYYVSFGGTGVNIAPTPNTSFGGTINYFVSQSNGTCESPRSVISVDVVDNPLAQITDTLVYILQGKYVQLTGEAFGNNVSILWTPNNGIDNPKIENPILLPNATQLYTMTVTSADNCISKANVRIIVQANINIPNVFSPNGDGINDTWDIENIVDYPFASISIFNRSGQLIKSSRTTTRKVWDGIYNGQLAPLGVYYYIIKLTPNSQPISGSITVLK
jgi:gliding motility-associated-like protein